jgi:hypothetical protein
MTVQIEARTALAWANLNPVLAIGEPGFETDKLKLKVGDGVTDWNSLSYAWLAKVLPGSQIVLPEDIDAAIAAQYDSFTDGQLAAWSESLGALTPYDPIGQGEIAYAENVTGVATDCGTNATGVDIPGTTIVVPAQTRPVYLSMAAACTISQQGNFFAVSIQEIANGVDTPLVLSGVVSTLGMAVNSYETVSLPPTRIGPTLRDRSFKLQMANSGSAFNTLNAPAFRTSILAEVK